MRSGYDFARHDDVYLFTHGYHDPEMTGWLVGEGCHAQGRLVGQAADDC